LPHLPQQCGQLAPPTQLFRVAVWLLAPLAATALETAPQPASDFRAESKCCNGGESRLWGDFPDHSAVQRVGPPLTTGKDMSRIYIVSYGRESRLVRANTRAQALNHVATGIINVDIPTQDQLIDLVAKGQSVETAIRPGQDELSLEQA